MATAYKVLGQVTAATSNTTLYTVPSATETIVSTISVCNLASTSATFRIAVRPDGASIENKHYIVYNATVPASDSTMLTLGIAMNASDVITVFSSIGEVSFNAFGSEIS
jgi:glucose-6-phosphate dehydrogenase assembly protein OpcA